MIAKAKAEYLKKSLPKDKLTPEGGGEFKPKGALEPEPELSAMLSMGSENSRPVADSSAAPVISDPDDPKFDLEAYLTMKMADEAK